MKKALARRPADFVRTSFPDERLWGLWSGIERAEARRRTRNARLRRAGAAGLALGVVVLALVLARPSLVPHAAVTPLAPAGSVASSDEARQLSLADGSTLSLSRETRAHVVAMAPVEVRVRLEHGTLECEVPPVPGRTFLVEAGGFEVVVKGTHFTVSLGADQGFPAGVTVSVERGSVEVREPPEHVLALLGPGQRWASEQNASAPSTSSAVPAACPTCAAPLPAVVADTPPAAASAPALATPGPRALFDRANTARLAGNTREAALAFDELRRRYPADVRAGHAAFMLGRMRLDTLGDPGGAVDAFSFAIAHPGSGFFLEDAEARLVEALAKAGKIADCRSARDRYLKNHPQGARAGLVARQCDAR